MRRKNSTPPDRGQEDQSITVGGLGTKGADYKTRVRAVTHDGVQSEWTNEVQFTLTDSTEGTATDPNLPDTVTNIVVKGMLNAIYVEFTDEFTSTTKPLMAYNMGTYEIEVSNVSNAFPSSGNVWTQTITGFSDAGPPGGDTRKFKVPTGDGFICTGMKSTAAGLTHYVRVRGINADGSAGAWDGSSPTKSVTLDTDDPSQTAVIIGQDAIHATHVKAGTLTATELLAGTITATEISSGEIFASSIQLPAASGADAAGGIIDGVAQLAGVRKFTIDLNGNMWWGNYATITTAQAGTNATGNTALDASTSWIDDTGNAQFIGTISTGAGSATNLFAQADSGEPRVVLGDNDTGLMSSTGYGFMLGFTGHANESIPGAVVFTVEDSGGAGERGAAYLVAPRYQSGTFNYAGVRTRHRGDGKGESILLVPDGASWAGMVLGTDENSVNHTTPGATFSVKAQGGIYLNNSSASATTTTHAGNRLWANSSGALYWGNTAVGGGSLDIVGLGTETSVVAGGVASDYAVFYDSSASSNKKVRFSNIAHSWFKADGLADMGSGNTTTSDLVMVYDSGSSLAKKVDLAEIIALAPSTTHLANGGLWQTSASGTIAISYSNVNQNVTPTTSDLVMFYDTSTASIAYHNIGTIVALAPSTTHLTNGGLWQTSASGTIAISFGNMPSATPVTSDLLMFYDYTTAAIAYANISTIQNLVGDATNPITHDFYLSGSRIIQATGNLYMRSGSGANYGVTAWSGGQTDIHYGTTIQLKTSTSGVQINGGTLYPSSNGIQNLGASNYYWKYLYATKMDRSAIPTFVGTGVYLIAGTNDTLYAYTSSERLKKNIVTIPVSDALNRIKALRPVEFSAKKNPSDLAIDNLWEYERFKGFIAEEAAAVDHGYGVYNWWKSNDPESEDYDKPRPSLSSIQDEWTDEEVAAYYDLDEVAPHVFDSTAILADTVAAIQALEARIAVLEG
jgi:hypothetical protein